MKGNSVRYSPTPCAPCRCATLRSLRSPMLAIRETVQPSVVSAGRSRIPSRARCLRSNSPCSLWYSFLTLWSGLM